MLNAFKLGLDRHFDFVITAQHGKEALDLVKSHDRSYFSVIVLDIDMPIMNGIEACIKINQYLTEEEKVASPDRSPLASNKISN